MIKDTLFILATLIIMSFELVVNLAESLTRKLRLNSSVARRIYVARLRRQLHTGGRDINPIELPFRRS